MRLANSLIAVLSLAALGGIHACSSDGDENDTGAGGSGGGGLAPAGGGGSTASSGAAGAPMGVAGSPQGGAGAVAGKAGAGGGGAAGAAAGSGGAPAGGKSGAGSGGVTAGASGGGAAGASGGGAAGASGGGAAGTSGGGAAGASGGGAAGSAGTAGASGGSGGGADARMNFFVTSDTSKTGDLGGLAKSDERCQTLAKAVGHGDKTWKAYLSVESPMTNAKDRIGPGPYYNSKGVMLAADKDALHALKGDPDLFIDEQGNTIDGQWNSAGSGNQHDIFTGTKTDGTLDPGKTCGDWTMNTGEGTVGHSDGMGPGMKTSDFYPYWTGSHTAQCGNPQASGGAGKIYCFVAP